MNCYKQFSKKLAKWGWRQDFTWFQILVTLSENYKFSDESRAFAIFYEQEVARRADNDTIVYASTKQVYHLLYLRHFLFCMSAGF